MSGPYGARDYGRWLAGQVDAGNISLEEATQRAVSARHYYGDTIWRCHVGDGSPKIDFDNPGANVYLDTGERVDAMFPYQSRIGRGRRKCSHCGNTSGKTDSKGMCVSCGAAL